jgi:Type II secretion system (T2SS), protein M subtype b
MTRMSAALQLVLSKAAALSILAAVVWGGVSCLAIPVWERFHSVNDRIAAQRELLGRYAAENSSNAGVESLGLPKDTDTQAFLPGETDALRLANLQATLNAAASTNKIRLASASAMESSEDSGVRLAGIQAQLSTDLEPLQKLLFSLEKQQANLIVDSLHIARAADTGPGTAPSGLPTLDVNFVLRGAVPLKPAKQE